MSKRLTHKAVAIIPARGNSKRISGKNLVKIGNKPLVLHTILSANKSRYLKNSIFISTEDSEISEVAIINKVKVIDRPNKLSQDKTSTLEVLKHSIKILENQKVNFDTIVLLQPTSPFRKPSTIDKAIKKLWDNWDKFNAIFSVKQSKFPPNWLLKIEKDKLSFIMQNDLKKIRTQDLDQTYEFDGLIYVYKKEFLKESHLYPFDSKASGYIISPKLEAIDIDDIDDLKIARTLLK